MIPLNPEVLPAELRETPCFVTYVAVPSTTKNGTAKVDKIPKNPRTGKNARANDPSTWSGISTALQAVERFGHSGIGIEFYRDYPYWGVDLDHCRDRETGLIDPWAQVIVDRFQPYCYIEPSPSGSGLHIIGRGAKPSWTLDESKKGGRRKGPIEFYPGGQFLTLTLDPLFPCLTLIDCTDTLAAWLNDTLEEPTPTPKTPPIAPTLSVADDELLKCCNGSEKFRRISAGDNSDYARPDNDGESEADLAFCCIVARNHGTREQADTLFRQSDRGRLRPKWDRADYRTWTLDKAFDGKVIPFSPGPRLAAHAATGVNHQDEGLVPDDLPDDLPSLKAIIIDLRSRVIIAEQRADAAETRAQKLSELQSKTTGIIRNKNLGQERFTAIAVAYQLGNREASGDLGENGLYPIPLARIAESAGVSEGTASKHLQALEKNEVIRREVRWIPEKVDKSTGEILAPGHKQTFVGAATNVTDFISAVAHLEPEEKNWGGLRFKRCDQHPDAKVVRTTVWTCDECGEELGVERSQPFKPIRREAETIRPNTQDDGFLDELAATGTDGPQRRLPLSQRGYTSTGSASGVTSHNGLATKVDIMINPPITQAEIEHAYAYANGAPIDRYTDVSIGGKP